MVSNPFIDLLAQFRDAQARYRDSELRLSGDDSPLKYLPPGNWEVIYLGDYADRDIWNRRSLSAIVGSSESKEALQRYKYLARMAWQSLPEPMREAAQNECDPSAEEIGWTWLIGWAWFTRWNFDIYRLAPSDLMQMDTGALSEWDMPFAASINAIESCGLHGESPRWFQQPRLEQTGTDHDPEPPQLKDRHSPDFRSVYWCGQHFEFSPMPAKVVEILWKALENNTPNVGQDYLLAETESRSDRLRDLFNKGKHPAWGTMIVQVKGKNGQYRISHFSR